MSGFLLAAMSATVAPHVTTNASTQLQLAPWQVINLLGAPLLAMLFARPVVDDLMAWFRSGRELD